MSVEALGEAVLSLAGAIESRLGPPASDPSLDAVPPGAEPLVHQLVYSMMLWESSRALAAECVGCLLDPVVDLNELRVCEPEEVCSLLPKACPLRAERSVRLIAALNAVFDNEHALSLERLNALPKREARQYLDSVEALPHFVASRIVLVSLGGHAFPADARVRAVLDEAGVAHGAGDDHDLACRLERAVRAPDLARVYALLEAEAEANPPPTRPRRRRPARARASTPPSEPDAGEGDAE